MLKVVEGGTPPKIKTKYSSSADLCSRVDIVIGAGETKIIPLGVKIDLDELKEIILLKEFGSKNWGATIKNKVLSATDKFVDNFLKSHFMELKLRSSLALKGLIIANGVGEIDIDYPDEIGLIVHNPLLSKQYVQNGENYTVLLDDDDNEFIIKAGDRVAQIKLMEHKNYLMPDRFRNDDIRTGGFGSTN